MSILWNPCLNKKTNKSTILTKQQIKKKQWKNVWKYRKVVSILNLDETLDNLFYNLTSIQYVYVLLRLNKTNKWTQQTANLHTHTLQFIVWIHTYIKERKQRVNFNLRSMLILILKKKPFLFSSLFFGNMNKKCKQEIWKGKK